MLQSKTNIGLTSHVALVIDYKLRECDTGFKSVTHGGSMMRYFQYGAPTGSGHDKPISNGMCFYFLPFSNIIAVTLFHVNSRANLN